MSEANSKLARVFPLPSSSETVRREAKLSSSGAVSKRISNALPWDTVPGKCAASEAWEGKWSDEECSLYQRYLKYLSGFEIITKFGQQPMFLLDWGPVDDADEVVIFKVQSDVGLAKGSPPE